MKGNCKKYLKKGSAFLVAPALFSSALPGNNASAKFTFEDVKKFFGKVFSMEWIYSLCKKFKFWESKEEAATEKVVNEKEETQKTNKAGKGTVYKNNKGSDVTGVRGTFNEQNGNIGFTTEKNNIIKDAFKYENVAEGEKKTFNEMKSSQLNSIQSKGDNKIVGASLEEKEKERIQKARETYKKCVIEMTNSIKQIDTQSKTIKFKNGRIFEYSWKLYNNKPVLFFKTSFGPRYFIFPDKDMLFFEVLHDTYYTYFNCRSVCDENEFFYYVVDLKAGDDMMNSFKSRVCRSCEFESSHFEDVARIRVCINSIKAEDKDFWNLKDSPDLIKSSLNNNNNMGMLAMNQNPGIYNNMGMPGTNQNPPVYNNFNMPQNQSQPGNYVQQTSNNDMGSNNQGMNQNSPMYNNFNMFQSQEQQNVYMQQPIDCNSGGYPVENQNMINSNPGQYGQVPQQFYNN